MKVQQEEAATKIQAIRRGNEARKQAVPELKAKLKAITKMQAVYRGQVDRKKVKDMKQQQEEAATKIQAIRRGNEARKQAVPELKAKLKAITKMQAVYRGQVDRKKVKDMKVQQQVVSPPFEETSYYGSIKSYNPWKGYGFISSKAFPDQDVFVFWSELPGGFGPEGSPCKFRVSMDEKGPAAKKVMLLGAAGNQIQQMKWMLGYGYGGFGGFGSGTDKTCWDFKKSGTCARASEGKCRWEPCKAGACMTHHDSMLHISVMIEMPRCHEMVII